MARPMGAASARRARPIHIRACIVQISDEGAHVNGRAAFQLTDSRPGGVDCQRHRNNRVPQLPVPHRLIECRSVRSQFLYALWISMMLAIGTPSLYAQGAEAASTTD